MSLFLLNFRSVLSLVLACVAGSVASADLSLKPCWLPGVEHEALCGVLKRPLDPTRPQGQQIDLNYAVVPALARNKKPDPVVFFAGGPGQSAIDLAGPVTALLSRFLNHRDLVLVDQRGTGRSAPLKCHGDDAGHSAVYLWDPSHQLKQWALCRHALQKLPHGDLRMYTTTIAMQDVDAVRQALGVQHINAIGSSYGTRAVLEYMRQFPSHVRRAVLDGVAPPDMVLPAASSMDNQTALDALFSSCEQNNACAAHHPLLRMRWQQLLASLPRTVTFNQPLTGCTQTIQLTRETLLAMVRLPLYSPSLAAGLPNALGQASAGRFDALVALASAVQGQRQQRMLFKGMHFSVICAEDVPQLGVARDMPGIDFGASFADQYRKACADWPPTKIPEAFYRMSAVSVPTLVLSGGSDPITPPRHGDRAVHALGPYARHIVVPHAGHGVMAIGCMRDVAYRFIDSEEDAQALKVDAQCMESLPRPQMFVPLQPSVLAPALTPIPQGHRR